MKKIALFVLAGILVLSFAACGRRNNDTDQNTTAPNTSQPTATDPQGTNATNIPDPTVNDNSTTDNGNGQGAVGEAVDDMMPGDNNGQTDTTDTTQGK